MYLLYLDDSGSVKNIEDKYIILAGISVFEQTPYFLSNQLDALVRKYFPNHENPNEIELHGAEIFGGRKQWRKIEKAHRIEIYKEALSIISNSGSSVRLFGAAINKSALAASISPKDSMEFAFEQLCNRFDLFLTRIHRGKNAKEKGMIGQRGLIVFDKSSYETSLQSLAIQFREKGHSWGITRNITEVPLFVDSQATRMIQYADLIAYALRYNFEYGDDYYLNKISKKFDSEGGISHGLYHYKPSGEVCSCLSCVSKTATKRMRQAANQ